MNYNALIKNLKKDYSGFKKIRIAFLGDSATQMMVKALRSHGYNVNYDFQIFEADYDQINRQVFDQGSELYQYNPDFVIIFHSFQKLVKKFYKLDNQNKKCFADRTIEEYAALYQTITSAIKAKIIFFNFPEMDDGIFGNYGNKTDLSFLYQIRKINLEMMNLSMSQKNMFVNDVSSLANKFGWHTCYDSKMYINADIVFSLDFISAVTKNLTDIILSISGSFKKCLIVDLDNTIWGGIIGDDGIENIQIGDLGIGKAFTELQLWIKQLKQRGIILAVCSKNNEENAKEPFLHHPEMVLRIEDIAVFVANWENKAQNIKNIQGVLNIGFDSMVFLDDNPFERNIVKSHIPQITVPDLPEDPSEYLTYLKGLNLFETASLTEEDELRTKQYQEEIKRTEVQKQFVNEDDFLANLEMKSIVKPFDKFNIPRVSQLTQRSNQFNLRTIRYTDDEISAISNSPDYLTFSFTLEDKFGDYGLISVIILKKNDQTLFIDTWIMSCRVLKRGMENFVLNQLIEAAKINNFNELIGEYIPTPKNNMVKDHYTNLGFKPIESEEKLYSLKTSDYNQLKSYIKNKQDE